LTGRARTRTQPRQFFDLVLTHHGGADDGLSRALIYDDGIDRNRRPAQRTVPFAFRIQEIRLKPDPTKGD